MEKNLLLSVSLDGRVLIEKEDYYIEPGKFVVKGSSLRMKWKAVVVVVVCCVPRRRLFQRIIRKVSILLHTYKQTSDGIPVTRA